MPCQNGSHASSTFARRVRSLPCRPPAPFRDQVLLPPPSKPPSLSPSESDRRVWLPRSEKPSKRRSTHRADTARAMKVAAAGKEAATTCLLRCVLLLLLLLLTVIYVLYALHVILSSTPSCSPVHPVTATTASAVSHITSGNVSLWSPSPPPPPPAVPAATTTLQHVVFGIAASARLWEKRKEYIKIWWRPGGGMRGFVWLDRAVPGSSVSEGLPPVKVSADTSSFPYTRRRGHRSAIRISRIVSETFRLSLPDVRWFVMGDDDTVFLPDNLIAVLGRLDHTQPYYIGAPSESHLQNIYFSYGMAFGGGGFAISWPLAARLERMQDACIRRYPSLYGSDDRIQACMAELGVPLTRHPGFHQYDVYGDLLGLLAAHPVAPLVTLHHLDVVRPLFPDARSRPAAVRRLFEGPVMLDSAGVMQQSICYDAANRWTVSVAWGFVVMVARGVITPREMETPARTFLNWYRRADYKAHAFNTRPLVRNPCNAPALYYLASARRTVARGGETTVTRYQRWRRRNDVRPTCRWKIPDPDELLASVIVIKKADPSLWDRSPLRNCCRVLPSPKGGDDGNKTMTVDVGVCEDWEFSHASRENA